MSHAKAYRNFFQESPAGESFISHITAAITAQHEKAENDPDKARDYVQRAKGIREVLDHISSVSAERKAKRT